MGRSLRRKLEGSVRMESTIDLIKVNMHFSNGKSRVAILDENQINMLEVGKNYNISNKEHSLLTEELGILERYEVVNE